MSILFARASTSIKTADGIVKSAPGWVHWVMVNAGATGGAWQLNDSTDDNGVDKVSGTQAANSGSFFGPFDPPIPFDNGIFADIPGTNITLTIGYN